MATTTRAVLRVLVSDSLGGARFTARTCTSQGAASGASIIDSGLAGFGTDYLTGWHVVLPNGPTGSSSAYETQEVDLFTSATGTIDPVANFSGQVANSQSYELHRFEPQLIHKAINEAIEHYFSDLSVPLLDESLIVDNLLSNPDFESDISGGAHPSWTNVGSPTVTADTGTKWHGDQAAKIVSGGSAGRITQAPTIIVREITGKSAVFGAWVYCTAASTARLRIDWDGTNFENHDYHSGVDQWERQKISATIPSTATQVKACCESVASGTSFFDSTWLAVDKIYKYTLPSTFAQVSAVEIQTSEDYPADPFTPISLWHYEEDADGKYLILDSSGYSAGYRLRVRGTGVLSALTSDTGTVEIGRPERELLVAGACHFVMRYKWHDPASQDKAEYKEKMEYWEREAERLSEKAGLRSMRQGVPMRRRYIWVR